MADYELFIDMEDTPTRDTGCIKHVADTVYFDRIDERIPRSENHIYRMCTRICSSGDSHGPSSRQLSLSHTHFSPPDELVRRG